MPRVRFTADYDHRWPSRAITAYKEGWSGPVKREVAEAAIRKGKATEIGRHVTEGNGPNPDLGRSRGLADPHHVDDVGALPVDQFVAGAGE